MLIDIILILILLISVLIGYKKGFIKILAGLISFILAFVLVKIVLLIVFFVLQKIFELPVLKSFNKLGGISVQVILTLLKISLVLAVLNFMSPMEFIQGIIAKIDSSVITKILYNHNIIADIILKKVI